jgi:hypothetical protein
MQRAFLARDLRFCLPHQESCNKASTGAVIRERNLESRAKGALCKDPHLRSSPFQGEGKNS